MGLALSCGLLGSNMGATKNGNGLGWGIGCRFDCNRAKEWGVLAGVLTEYHFFLLSFLKLECAGLGVDFCLSF